MAVPWCARNARVTLRPLRRTLARAGVTLTSAWPSLTSCARADSTFSFGAFFASAGAAASNASRPIVITARFARRGL